MQSRCFDLRSAMAGLGGGLAIAAVLAFGPLDPPPGPVVPTQPAPSYTYFYFPDLGEQRTIEIGEPGQTIALRTLSLDRGALRLLSGSLSGPVIGRFRAEREIEDENGVRFEPIQVAGSVWHGLDGIEVDGPLIIQSLGPVTPAVGTLTYQIIDSRPE